MLNTAMKNEPYSTPSLPTMPSTSGMPIKPTLQKIIEKRSTRRRPLGSLRKNR